jgi:hypothetical protein
VHQLPGHRLRGMSRLVVLCYWLPFFPQICEIETILNFFFFLLERDPVRGKGNEEGGMYAVENSSMIVVRSKPCVSCSDLKSVATLGTLAAS